MREGLRGGIQQACTDEDFLTLLDLANSDPVSEWYSPAECFSAGGLPCAPVPCAPHVDNLVPIPNFQINGGLNSQSSNQSIPNYVWEFGMGTWNAASVGCHLGEFSSVEYRP